MSSPALFSLVFVMMLLADLAARMWLSARQMRHVAGHRDQVPAEFADRINLASHQRAADYTRARARLGMLEQIYDAVILLGLTLFGGLQWLNQAVQHVYDAAILLGLTLSGGLQWLNQAVQHISAHALPRQLLLLLAVTAIMGVLDLPFTLWRQFRLEARFGFNRMTPALFVVDAVKGIALGLVLGLPLAAAVLWLMGRAGSIWWLWAWGLWMAFNLLMLFIYPMFIAPLFNKFTPLTDAVLADRIRLLAQRCGFALGGLFVMDGSRRSGHGNAYFTGFGKARRIVFFDTLLARLNADEIEAVLAHELGHFAHGHIVKRIVTSFVLALVFFSMLGWLAQQPWFYAGLGASMRSDGSDDAMALLLFFLALPVFTFFLTPLGSWYSRRNEFEADRYAARQSSAAQLVSALVQLYDDNAATLTPDPVHSAFYDSHPPASVRIRHLMQAASQPT
ncbi:MAG: M48 family metallopeptidase [Bordetella sp.]|uniref:M48 family metallopeptidase n=1 Tax=Bordetella sp. TaxID=28081 RepID=UPI003F7BE7FF